MKKTDSITPKQWLYFLTLVMMLQLIAASYFCMRKQGFHYDEYYSYYSSNVTYGLAPTDREWKNAEEIRSEFMVLPGQGFRYGMVKLMQTYDVHPPLYYFLLHTVCSFFPGIFSKWFGLGLNLLFFIIAYWLFAGIAYSLFQGNHKLTACSCLLFGFQPGLISAVTFIRMYMLLLVWCLAIICWHIPLWKEGIRLSPKRIASLLALVTAGFLTHYYFAVFLFFLTAFTCLYHWLGKKNLKGSIGYGAVVCTGMALAVLLYPASLAHIFRGYRGTEATEAFFDLSNTLLRLDFFTKLMNSSVFGGGLGFLALLLVITAAVLAMKKKKKKVGRDSLRIEEKDIDPQGLFCLLTVTLGYFLVVAKTALLNAQEANRYELPVYGFWLLIVLAGFFCCGKAWEKLGEKKNKEGQRKGLQGLGILLITGSILGCQLFALSQGKVQFLYTEDRENVNWAKAHSESVVVYLYNPANAWMIWDEAEELMQYKEIYFVNLADTTPITDPKVLQADRIYVYSSRLEEGEKMIDQLLEEGTSLTQKEKIRSLLYCDLYCLE